MNGYFYVGSSINIDKRFWRHKNELRKNKHHCLFLQRAWNKYGEKQFEFIVLKECPEEEARRLEQRLLDEHIANTYNLNRFASGGDLLSAHPNKDAIVQKTRQTLINRLKNMSPEEKKEMYGLPGEKNPMYGRSHSSETKFRISTVNKGNTYAKGKKRTIETKMKLSIIASQRIGSKNPFFGMRHTNETKQKISEANKGRKPSNQRVVIIDEIEYVSVTEASRVIKVVPATILHRIRSKNPKFSGYNYKE